PAALHDRDLGPDGSRFLDLSGDRLDLIDVDTGMTLLTERLAADLEQHALVFGGHSGRLNQMKGVVASGFATRYLPTSILTKRRSTMFSLSFATFDLRKSP